MKQLVVCSVLLAVGALWLSVGAASDVDPTPIECVIAARKIWFLGATPKIDVRLINRSNRPIYLVGSLDGSSGGRSPRAQFEITPPLGAPSPNPIEICGNENELRAEDFVRVEPGATFDPYQHIDDHGYFQDSFLSSSFNVAGMYYVRFLYSTTDPDMSHWLGGPLPPGYVPSFQVRALLRQVPRVEVRSNVIALQFIKS